MVVLLLALVAVTAGCSQPDASAEAQRERRTASPACLDVPADVLEQIAVGAETGMTFEPSAGAAVQADSGVYVVAVRFQGDSAEPEVGVWTMAALEGTVAPLLVADETSSAYTTWMTVQDFPQYGVPLDSPLIDAARTCLGA